MDRIPDDKIITIMRGIKRSDFGQEFVQYLEQLSLDNYKSFKHSDSKMNDIHKGYALCIDNLLEVFEACEKEQAEQQQFNID